ncbi:short-chain dehydrogenase/reductase family 9C member 7-like [Saccostrea echinata]|uniref:short-chain dehydrogenase/reductase family 9C member 7-like n=1 Tax=Saccostrea echinata TaxID=191078 RepID=UPI002A83EBA9|nr:short-chain dehydrogenase/reductase family 9C member 7-like [Saccostrea echinata]
MDLLTLLGGLVVILCILKSVELYMRTIFLDTKNKCVLVTGCDTGFGHLLAQELDKRGIRVFASCLTEEGEKRLLEKCSSKAVVFRLDVTKEESIQNAVYLVKAKLAGDEVLWGLVNNAGVILLAAPLEWQTKEQYEKTLAVNLFGVIEMTRAFLPLLRKSKGRVVNMSSIASMLAIPKLAPYNISKAAIESYTDTLRREMYNIGVTAHLIQPSGFTTNVFPADATERLRKAFDELPQEVKEFYGEKSANMGHTDIVKARVTLDPDLTKVTRVIQHALFARYPRYRYPVGKGAVSIFWTFSHFPEIIPDKLLAISAP